MSITLNNVNYAIIGTDEVSIFIDIKEQNNKSSIIYTRDNNKCIVKESGNLNVKGFDSITLNNSYVIVDQRVLCDNFKIISRNDSDFTLVGSNEYNKLNGTVLWSPSSPFYLSNSNLGIINAFSVPDNKRSRQKDMSFNVYGGNISELNYCGDSARCVIRNLAKCGKLFLNLFGSCDPYVFNSNVQQMTIKSSSKNYCKLDHVKCQFLSISNSIEVCYKNTKVEKPSVIDNLNFSKAFRCDTKILFKYNS